MLQNSISPIPFIKRSFTGFYTDSAGGKEFLLRDFFYILNSAGQNQNSRRTISGGQNILAWMKVVPIPEVINIFA